MLLHPCPSDISSMASCDPAEPRTPHACLFWANKGWPSIGLAPLTISFLSLPSKHLKTSITYVSYSQDPGLWNYTNIFIHVTHALDSSNNKRGKGDKCVFPAQCMEGSVVSKESLGQAGRLDGFCRSSALWPWSSNLTS